MNPYKVFINGGGSSPYDAIALENGWKVGANSDMKNRARRGLFMVDNNWQNYCHTTHLKFVSQCCPHLATVRDIEPHVNQVEVISQAMQLSEFADRLVIIPKTEVIPDLLGLPDIILGLPLGREENPISWDYAINKNFPIHCLGGSPVDWMKAIDRLGLHRIYSLDGNYLSAIARFGKIFKNGRTRKPHQWEVPDGEKFNYRCFAHSVQWVNCTLFTPRPKQLRLAI